MAKTVTTADLKRAQQQVRDLPNGHPAKTAAAQMLMAYKRHQQAQNSPGALYARAQEEAKKANESRYAELLEGYRQREKTGMDRANLAANQGYRQESAAAMQDLVSRGLRGSTEAPRAFFDAYERNQQIPLATYLQTTGDTLGVMERRTDAYPDLGQLLALAQAQGQGAGAGIPVGGGGGGPVRLPPMFGGMFGGALRQRQQPNKVGAKGVAQKAVPTKLAGAKPNLAGLLNRRSGSAPRRPIGSFQTTTPTYRDMM